MPLYPKMIAVFLGSLLVSIGINFFLAPNEVLDGGIIGVGLIANYVWGVKTGLTIIFLSIPIYVIAWFRYRHYFFNSLHGMLLSSFFIDLFHPLPNSFPIHLYFLPWVSSIIGGLLVGAGIGLMLRYKTSTGGTDLLALFLSSHFPLNVGFIIFFIDAIVISCGGVFISAQTFYLSIVTISSVGLMTSICTWDK